MLLSITFILHLISGFIPVTRLIQFNLGIISIFLSGILLGPLMGQVIVLADDSLNFLVHNNGNYHPGFAFGLCIMSFFASMIGWLLPKLKNNKQKVFVIYGTVFLTYTLISLFINPIILVALGWIPNLSLIIYIPRLIKWIPEVLFYSSIISLIYFGVIAREYKKLKNDSYKW